MQDKSWLWKTWFIGIVTCLLLVLSKERRSWRGGSLTVWSFPIDWFLSVSHFGCDWTAPVKALFFLKKKEGRKKNNTGHAKLYFMWNNIYGQIGSHFVHKLNTFMFSLHWRNKLNIFPFMHWTHYILHEQLQTLSYDSGWDPMMDGLRTLTMDVWALESSPLATQGVFTQ